MATLADLLALFPDNTTGEIDAVDMRVAVEGLWDMGTGASTVEAIQFDTAGSTQHSPGLMHWDTTSETLSMDTEFSTVSLQIGFESWTRVRNQSGSTINRGAPVRITGSTGQRPRVALDNGQGQIYALAAHTIANNEFGIVTTHGLIRNVNTSAFNDGDNLYATSGGAFTTSATGSFAGRVVLANTTGGIILARPTSLDQADGTTANRPTARPTGFMYFDTTLGRPIWWNGASWVDATGAGV